MLLAAKKKQIIFNCDYDNNFKEMHGKLDTLIYQLGEVKNKIDSEYLVLSKCSINLLESLKKYFESMDKAEPCHNTNFQIDLGDIYERIIDKNDIKPKSMLALIDVFKLKRLPDKRSGRSIRINIQNFIAKLRKKTNEIYARKLEDSAANEIFRRRSPKILRKIEEINNSNKYNKLLLSFNVEINNYLNVNLIGESERIDKKTLNIYNDLVDIISGKVTKTGNLDINTHLVNAAKLCKEKVSDDEISNLTLGFILENIKNIDIPKYLNNNRESELTEVILDTLPSLNQLYEISIKMTLFESDRKKIFDTIKGVILDYIDKIYKHYTEELIITGSGFRDMPVLEEIVRNATSTIFCKGTTDPSRSISNLFYISDNPEIHSRVAGNLRGKVEFITKNFFDVKPNFVNGSDSVPIIYFENYFRASEEISNIRQLENTYVKYMKNGQHLHFDRRITDYEMLTKNIKKKSEN